MPLFMTLCGGVVVVVKAPSCSSATDALTAFNLKPQREQKSNSSEDCWPHFGQYIGDLPERSYRPNGPFTRITIS